MSIPDIIYKYSSYQNAGIILETRKLKYTSPSDFNDPFDTLPGAYTDLDDALIHQIAKEKASSHRYFELVKSKIPSLRDIRYDSYLKWLETSDLINDIAISIKQAFENRDFTTLREQLKGHLAICCFSGKKDNIIMWSHYADEHRGVVIGFDSSIEKKLHEVVYSDDRVSIPFGGNKDSPEYRKAVEYALITKCSDWRYEGEYRTFKVPSQLEQEGDVLLGSFDKEKVAEVLLGARIPEDQRVTFIDLIKSHYPKTAIYQMKMDKKKYKLNL